MHVVLLSFLQLTRTKFPESCVVHVVLLSFLQLTRTKFPESFVVHVVLLSFLQLTRTKFPENCVVHVVLLSFLQLTRTKFPESCVVHVVLSFPQLTRTKFPESCIVHVVLLSLPHFNSYSASHDNWYTVGGDGGCRVGEVRVNFQKFSTLRVNMDIRTHHEFHDFDETSHEWSPLQYLLWVQFLSNFLGFYSTSLCWLLWTLVEIKLLIWIKLASHLCFARKI